MKRLTKKANTLKRILAILLAVVMMSSFTVTIADSTAPSGGGDICTDCGELEDSCVCDPIAQTDFCADCGEFDCDGDCDDSTTTSTGGVNPDFDIADHLIVNASGQITGFISAGAPKDITIPVKSKGGVNITSIGDSVFASTGLTSLSFESGSQITSIGAYAFQKNPITAITNLPTTLKTIGTSAFSETDITEITLPSGVS
ncbi:MAG: leucine-rich repeat domain-containing protein, partial [Oscillospiraceae bacterium]|nr:leucine-rich repeat domain-containing protein [Oscillospiraceae bacterium]